MPYPGGPQPAEEGRASRSPSAAEFTQPTLLPAIPNANKWCYFLSPASQSSKTLLEICAAIDLVERVLSQTGRLSAVQYAFEPHVNKGRLDGMNPHWDDALKRFRRLKLFREGEGIEIAD